MPGLASDAEGALAWALREAVTNVVRHSGALLCVVALTTEEDPGAGPASGPGPAGAGTDAAGAGTDAEQKGTAVLTVSDDGRGPAPGHVPGNGLSGLTERLILAGGTVDTLRTGDGGFTLKATVPLRLVPVAVDLRGGGE